VAGKPKRVEGHAPDGLSEHVVDRLIAEVDQTAVEAPVATSALVDGSAAERRRRRIERRMLAAVVRSLPSLRTLPGSVGEAA
jgi:hypothetical protein